MKIKRIPEFDELIAKNSEPAMKQDRAIFEVYKNCVDGVDYDANELRCFHVGHDATWKLVKWRGWMDLIHALPKYGISHVTVTSHDPNLIDIINYFMMSGWRLSGVLPVIKDKKGRLRKSGIPHVCDYESALSFVHD